MIGVLGGIASGKSEVARNLAASEGEVIDADVLAHGVLQTPELRGLLSERFGESLIGTTGEIDRAALGRVVFANPTARRALEALVHPRVRELIRRRLDAALARRVSPIVLDVPLLLENDAQHHLVAECDALVFVDAPPEQREQRARAVRRWPAGELAKREAVQMPLADKRARADFVIANESGREELRAATLAVLEQIHSRRGAR